MGSTLDNLKLLTRASIYEFLQNIKDPKRELLERMEALRRELEKGRHELAHQSGSLGDYEAAETNLQQQIEFEEGLAKQFANINEEVAAGHIRKQMALEKQLDEARSSTADDRKAVEELEATVELAAQHLAILEKTYSQIEAMGTRTEMLNALTEIARQQKQAEDLQGEQEGALFKAEALAQMHGIDTNTKPDEDEVTRRLAGMKKG